MKPDQEQVCALLKETVALLCRNGLTFNTGLHVQGLLGITVDDQQVFIVQMDEVLYKDYTDSKPDIRQNSETQDFISAEYPTHKSADGVGCSRKRRRRLNSQGSFPSDANMAFYDGTALYANDVITIGEDEDDKEVKRDRDEQYGGQLDTESETYKPNPHFIYDSNFGNVVELPKSSYCADQLDQYETFDNNESLTITAGNSELQQQQSYSTVSRCTTVVRRGVGRMYNGRSGHLQQHIKQVYRLKAFNVPIQLEVTASLVSCCKDLGLTII